MFESIIAIFCIVLGAGISVIWTRDIVSGEQLDLSRGRLRARNEEGTYLLAHWIAEYATAATLLISGVGLLTDAEWGTSLAFVGLGALIYTSTNSMGWALATKERLPYAVPMAIGGVGALVSVAGLLAQA